jgi:molecular chaperone GrpE
VFKKEKRPETKPKPPSGPDAEGPDRAAEGDPDQIPSNPRGEETGPMDEETGPPVYEYDPEAPEPPADETPDGVEEPKTQPRESAESHRVTKREVVERLFEKNEVIVKLTRQAKDLEKERKRTRKEWDLLKQQTKAEVLLEILDVIDDFERAFTVVGERDDEFVQGIRLIYNNMLSKLERIGVRKIEALNTPFDPTYHMAIAQRETKDAKKNDVVEVAQNGYLLDNIVIRPSRVVVAK